MTVHEDLSTSQVPEHDAQIGGAGIVTGGGTQIVLSEAARWMDEDGLHVIRSTEFDCYAEGATFEEALDVFIDQLTEYALLLVGLVERGEATEDEEHASAKLSARFMEAYQRRVREERARRRRLFPRHRGAQVSHWQHRATQPGNSSALSRA